MPILTDVCRVEGLATGKERQNDVHRPVNAEVYRIEGNLSYPEIGGSVPDRVACGEMLNSGKVQTSPVQPVSGVGHS